MKRGTWLRAILGKIQARAGSDAARTRLIGASFYRLIRRIASAELATN
ncbi:hypothetical protein RPPS3_14380 [Rhodopseudomonas palustris]|nr:hypothetical protein RPPS3_14380 [Rhodopseudomonas palustris]